MVCVSKHVVFERDKTATVNYSIVVEFRMENGKNFSFSLPYCNMYVIRFTVYAATLA